MKKEFLPYDRALKLKQLGFDEPCLGFYERNQELVIQECFITDFHGDSLQCVAPLFQQAFRWFGEEHGLFGNPGISNFANKTYGYNVTTLNVPHYLFNAHSLSSMEEAELACIDKLIELVELKQQEQ
jgi:hypothetical protein